MRIEIFSDIVCPWCFVGQSRLAAALARRPEMAAEVIWLPFELNPTMPTEGRPRADYLRERFGDVNRFADAQRQLQEIGEQEGIRFDFNGIQRMPNTRRAHVLLAYIRRESPALQTRAARLLFEAYFSEGLDIGDPHCLAELAERLGLDSLVVTPMLDDATLHAEVQALETLAARWNVSGVPTFILDRCTGFSGAQPVAVFERAFDSVLAQTRNS
ncbi:MAG: DsbA family oxidoreductase [Steroidobacteraceae bacterium]